MNRRSPKYPPGFQQRAVQMVSDARSSFPSESAAIRAVAGVLGIDDPDLISKWMKSAEHDKENKNSKRPALKRVIFRSHTVIIGSVVTILGGLGLAYSQQFFGLSATAPESSSPHLELDQVTPSYGNWTATGPKPFTIDIKLLNAGSQIAIINSAKLTIQNSAMLQACAGQGGFPSTGSYPANLPANPSPGSIVNIPISQTVPANGVDRFDLLLDTPISLTNRGAIYLYRFTLDLTYNAHNSRLNVGTFVISSPTVPTENQYFWGKSWAKDPDFFDTMMSHNGTAEVATKECDIKDSRILQAFLSLSGIRPPELSKVPSRLAY